MEALVADVEATFFRPSHFADKEASRNSNRYGSNQRVEWSERRLPNSPLLLIKVPLIPPHPSNLPSFVLQMLTTK